MKYVILTALLSAAQKTTQRGVEPWVEGGINACVYEYKSIEDYIRCLYEAKVK